MSTIATQRIEPPAPSKSNNLLYILHKWASGQDENFVTDSFAHLLRCLQVCEPGVAVDLLAKLTGDFIRLAPEQASKVNVLTQVTTDHGRPDIEISLPGYLAYVEVKVEAEVNQKQLARYQQALQKSGVPHTRLILLTRYPQILDSEKDNRDNQGQWFPVRWFQIVDWLERRLRDALLIDPVGMHVVNQFVSFLQVRNIAMEQIRPELSAGLRSLRGLLLMVEEALASCKVSSKHSRAWDYIGLDCDSNRFWVGVYYDEPEALVFETNEFDLDEKAPALLEVGGIVKDHPWQRGKRWTNRFDLSPERQEFFSRSQSEQRGQVETFVRDCIDKITKIEMKQSRQ